MERWVCKRALHRKRHLCLPRLESIGSDELALLSKEGLNLFSMFFGNSVGLIETRRGKLYRRPQLAASIRQELRAGDILLEKTPFRLTDMLIPGFWGHAAIWTGSEEELKALGIWQHPLVVAITPISARAAWSSRPYGRGCVLIRWSIF